jgi:hypothetical protein
MLTFPCNFNLEKEAKALEGTYANYSHYSHRIDVDAKVYAPDESLFARYMPSKLSAEVLELALPVMQAVKTPITNRGTAAYKGSMFNRVRKSDGLLGATRVVAEEVAELLGYSDQIGYLEGKPGTEARGTQYCRSTQITRKHPERLAQMLPLALEVDGIFEMEMPTEYAAQVAAIAGAGEYRITDAYSTINLNRDWQTAYHPDANDLPDGWAAIFVGGDYAGGDLVVPRYRLRFELRPGTLLFFKPHEIHGNLPFEGELLQGVLFGREHIASCGGQ